MMLTNNYNTTHLPVCTTKKCMHHQGTCKKSWDGGWQADQRDLLVNRRRLRPARACYGRHQVWTDDHLRDDEGNVRALDQRLLPKGFCRRTCGSSGDCNCEAGQTKRCNHLVLLWCGPRTAGRRRRGAASKQHAAACCCVDPDHNW